MRILPEKNIPRWVIFLIDVGICLFSLFLAYLIRFDFTRISAEDWQVEKYVLLTSLPVYILVRAISFRFGKTYSGIVRYTSTEDAKRIFLTVTIGSLVLVALMPVRELIDGYYFLPRPIIIVDYMITVILMITLRIAVKLLYAEQKKSKNKDEKKVLIWGAGELGLITKRTIDSDSANTMFTVGFLDDDQRKSGKTIEGVRIFDATALSDAANKTGADAVIVAIMHPDKQKKRALVDECMQLGLEVLNVPPVDNWLNGQLSLNQIKNIRIEDLLGRKEIKLSKENISDYLAGKKVLVTGAAGSIGSELVRQVIRFNPQKIVLLDQAESPLYDIENEIKNLSSKVDFEVVIGDISNVGRMGRLFEYFQPQVVFHAAAYKHVPLMESNPTEAILVNVLGTRVLAEFSIASGVEKFVMISTDKAVNPTNVMGASKRVAEMFVQSLNGKTKTAFITTRFGNVLGSNGSVIPLFKKQIEMGGPITVTHEEITRYFMTITEACQLVLEAGSMGVGGEIYVFDMGESVKIVDLARKMIKLSGFELERDIQIKITGLRPGEKLYEELLTTEENSLPTHHPQILIGKVQQYEHEWVKDGIEELAAFVSAQDNENLIKRIKQLVPEYKSNNSVFSKFDD
ncbi:MAG: polysaccharide biosynthesis protein [Flavobacteriales bacterium]